MPFDIGVPWPQAGIRRTRGLGLGSVADNRSILPLDYNSDASPCSEVTGDSTSGGDCCGQTISES